jgi:DNA-binding NarL/FixJ family response regulator
MLVAEGLSNTEIGTRLHNTPATHRHRRIRKRPGRR